MKLQNLCLQSYYKNSATGDFLGIFQNFGNSYAGRLLKHSPAIISLVPFFNIFQKALLRHKFGICFFESRGHELWSWTQKKFDFKIMLSQEISLTKNMWDNILRELVFSELSIRLSQYLDCVNTSFRNKNNVSMNPSLH